MITRARKSYHIDGLFKKPFLKWVTFLTLFCCLFFAATQSTKISYFPIKNVTVAGAKQIDHQVIQHLLTPLVKKSFFAVDVERIKDQLLQIPWVSQVVVRRVWPNRVMVFIQEKIPIARWNENSLLSSKGDVFTPTHPYSANNLPTFIGLPGQQLLMMQYYAKMNQLLAPLHYKLSKLELTQTASWHITLDNGMKLNAGHKDVLTRLDHFVRVYPKIVGTRGAEVDYVDLRYPNGMAVRWKASIINV